MIVEARLINCTVAPEQVYFKALMVMPEDTTISDFADKLHDDFYASIFASMSPEFQSDYAGAMEVAYFGWRVEVVHPSEFQSTPADWIESVTRGVRRSVEGVESMEDYMGRYLMKPTASAKA